MNEPYHVEERRPGANLSEFKYCIYGKSSSPHPYFSFPTITEAQSRCEILNGVEAMRQEPKA